jgi:hypothetical protein
MRLIVIAIMFFSFISINYSKSQNVVSGRDSIEIKYDTSLQKIVKIYEQVKSFYKVLDKLQPIAIAENNYFYIFDSENNSEYKFIKKAPVSFPIPQGIRAAMPLESYNFKSVCVVTGDAFDNLENCILVFHEFVHCTQFQTVEMNLKGKLEINKIAMEKQDYMWEINYGFPYTNEDFVKTYSEFIDALDKQDSISIKTCRCKLKNILSKNEYEYLTWQEWKEGYARYVENKLQAYFELNINEYGKLIPFNRITFYAGGSKYIDYLIQKEPTLKDNLELLYKRIFEI